jgi:divalent metal cation (Fe/Co/Zn/Cd) transporter
VTSQHSQLRRAVLLSAVSVTLGGIVGATAVVLGLATSTLSLLGFGFDAAIDAVASVALMWRFSVEVREPHRGARVEAVGERVVGGVLLVLATYLAITAVRALVAGAHPEATVIGTAILVLSVLVLPPLAVAKLRVARILGSGALRADSVLTAGAAVLALISLVGIGVSELFGLWWGDAVGAIIVAVMLFREGWLSARLGQQEAELDD